ncbi:MAG: hypothetical protein U1A73_24125 [Pseudomonas sp.]|nr:hypothetical protein [Pseudomonas sp.]
MTPGGMFGLVPSMLIGAVASARSMTPMAALAAAHALGRRLPGRLFLLHRPLFTIGALAMGPGELLGDTMKSAPDRTVFLGLLARVISAGIAGAALAPRRRAPQGAMAAILTAVPLAYLTLAARKRATRQMGQTRSGVIEDLVVAGAGIAIVATQSRKGCALPIADM